MLKLVGENECDRMEAEDRVRKAHFAAHVAYGTPLVKAMRLSSFDRPSRPAAAKLMSDPFVQSEVSRHQALLQEDLRSTRVALAAQFDEAAELAHNLENPAAVVAALVAKAKVLGLLADRPDARAPSRITVEWGEESRETVYERSNPLLHGALVDAAGSPGPVVDHQPLSTEGGPDAQDRS